MVTTICRNTRYLELLSTELEAVLLGMFATRTCYLAYPVISDHSNARCSIRTHAHSQNKQANENQE